MTNEAFERVSLEQACKCALTKGCQLYLEREDKYAEEKFLKCDNGCEYLVAVDSTDWTFVELRYRTPDLPDGDLGWLIASFCTDGLTLDQILDAIYSVVTIREGW